MSQARARKHAHLRPIEAKTGHPVYFFLQDLLFVFRRKSFDLVHTHHDRHGRLCHRLPALHDALSFLWQNAAMGPHHHAVVQRHRHGLVPRARHHLPSHIRAEPHHRDRHRRLHDTAYLYGICPCCRHASLFLAPHDGRACR